MTMNVMKCKYDYAVMYEDCVSKVLNVIKTELIDSNLTKN